MQSEPQSDSQPLIPNTHPPSRIVALTDGVVAIAITVLVLPLAAIELPESVQESNDQISYIWTTYSQLIMSFLISWLVIISFWFDHHKVFGRLQLVDGFIVRMNMAWLFAIVVLPFPTNLLSQDVDGPTKPMVTFYLIVLTIASATLLFIDKHADRNPQLVDSRIITSKSDNLFSYASTCYIFLLVILSTIIGPGTMWGLLGLIPLSMILRRAAAKENKNPEGLETV